MCCSQAHNFAHNWPPHALPLTGALCNKGATNIHINSLIEYKSWADSLLYESLCQLPVPDLKEQRPMLFGSILALLNHIYAMDVVWSSNLQGIAHGMETRNPKDVPSFNVLRNKQSEINSWYKDYAANLSSKKSNETIKFSFIGGGVGAMKKHEILHHIVNHASYHRGHIEGVMYQMSIEPPTTDISVFLQAKNA